MIPLDKVLSTNHNDKVLMVVNNITLMHIFKGSEKVYKVDKTQREFKLIS